MVCSLCCALALFAASAVVVSPVEAQRVPPGQVLVLEEPIIEVDSWIADVVAVDVGTCPGAAWLGACGAAATSAGCASLREAGEALGEGGRAACLASIRTGPVSTGSTSAASLVRVAEALFRAGERDTLEWAAALYGALARVEGLGAMASLRAARAAERLDRPREAMVHLYELLRAEPPAPIRAAAIRLGGAIVSKAMCDGRDERDPVQRARCVSADVLPDAPWAAQLALGAVDALVWQERFAEARTLADAARARFGRTVADGLDRAELRAALASRDFEDRVLGAERCHARGAGCAQPLIDSALRRVVEQLARCRAGVDLERSIAVCSGGHHFGERILALRPLPSLAQDVAAAAAWLEASEARLQAEAARRGRRRSERRAAEAVLARPLPPDVQVATAAPAPPLAPAPLDLGFIRPGDLTGALERRSAALARCADARAAHVSLTLRFDARGVVRAAEPSASTAASRCVARALQEPELRVDVAGAASAHALVMLPPSPSQ